MDYKFYHEVETYAKGLVSTPSVVKGGTESNAAQYVYDQFKDLDYFKENPDQLIIQKTLNDEYDRHSTLALLKGNGKSNKTILLMGHIDTVEVNDFGHLKEFAFDPDRLIAEMKKLDNLDEDVKRDLDSGDYMFGRGALDMKSGVAGHIALLRYFAQHRDELDGNLAFIAECDEEDGSRGIISGLKVLNEWKEKHDLDYVVAINADYSTPYYQGDPNRYVYLGTIGKLLPTFFIAGKESHVGQAFSAFDPNYMLAAITERLTLNSEFSDTANGETTVPPISLKQEDLKEVYTVQTALYAHGFYNFFTHGMTPKDVLVLLKNMAIEVGEELVEKINEDYRIWCEKAEFPYAEIDWDLEVLTWDEYEDICRKKFDDYDKYMEDFKKKLHRENPDMDLRYYSLAVVREAYEHFRGVPAPAVFIYYSSVYSQNIEIKKSNPEHAKVVDDLYKAVEEVQQVCEDPIQVKYFFPYIADSSFVYIPEDREGINAFMENMPAWGDKFVHPIEDMEAISMPVVNIGTYGKDGHMNTERVHKEYTWEMVPRMSYEMIKNTFK